MLTVETIRKIRLSIHRDGKSIRQTAKELRVSRNTVRKAVRSQQTAFTYRRSSQPRPALGAFVERLETALAEDQKIPKRQRRTAIVLLEQVQAEGYTGSYDSIRRHVRVGGGGRAAWLLRCLSRWCLIPGLRGLD